MTHTVANEAETLALAARLARQWSAGDVVQLVGDLGAGKTTLVRGIVHALGHVGPVRSPTFNLIQTFPTSPPVLHADLYRLTTADGLGLEDYLDSHLCLIEWPDRAPSLTSRDRTWTVRIEFGPQPDARVIHIESP